jgi:ABC-2 type transport system ATP-binding protein
MVCDRVSIIHRGVLRTTGHVADLLAGSQVRIVATGITPDLLQKLTDFADRVDNEDGQATIWESDEHQVDEIVDMLRGAKAKIVSLTPERRSLEDIFIETVREVAPITPTDPPVTHPE